MFCFSGPLESERAERERKGDLDQYERLDGDRNQTSKSLAVKKVFPISPIFCFRKLENVYLLKECCLMDYALFCSFSIAGLQREKPS